MICDKAKRQEWRAALVESLLVESCGYATLRDLTTELQRRGHKVSCPSVARDVQYLVDEGRAIRRESGRPDARIQFFAPIHQRTQQPGKFSLSIRAPEDVSASLASNMIIDYETGGQLVQSISKKYLVPPSVVRHVLRTAGVLEKHLSKPKRCAAGHLVVVWPCRQCKCLRTLGRSEATRPQSKRTGLSV